MRLFQQIVLLALLGACGNRAELTPPIQATPPAADADSELAPSGRLPTDTRPESYALELSVDPRQPSFRGRVTIDVTLDRPRESIWLHSRVAQVGPVTVEREGAPALVATLERVGESGLAAVRLRQPVGPGRVRLVLPFESPFGARLTGLYRAESAGVPYAFTQFEAISAREAFPCFDEPRFKTPFALTLRIPREQVAIANTRVLEERELDAETRELRFATTEKLPTYLVALAVGPFDVVSAPPLPKTTLRDRELPLRGVAVRSRGPELDFALRDTPALLAWLEAYFGVAYAYDKLDLIAVPDFGAGAMENAGAITFRDTLLLIRPDAPEQQRRRLGYVNAHELAHQWFGNLVTMPWWDDIWLNEAFATWMGTRAIEHVHPEYEAALGALAATHDAMEIDSRASSRKIRQPIESDHDIENAFDAITYSKGGAVLSMFERYLGAAQFQRALGLHMERFRFGTAGARDLIRTLSEVSGERALEPAFFSFLDQPGVPLLRMSLDCSKGAPAIEVAQARSLPLGTSASGDPSWQVPLCFRYATRSGAPVEQCALLTERTARLELKSDGCPAWLVPNAGAQGYYRWTVPDALLDAQLAPSTPLSIPEQMSLVSNVTSAFRGGLLSAERTVAVLRSFARSPNRHVMDTALRGYALVRELLDPESLPAFRDELARGLLPAYKKLGLVPRKRDVSGEEKLTRASLVRGLYFLAEEPSVTRELARWGRPLLEGDASADSKLPSELRELALSAALREHGAPLFERAQQQLFAASDGIVRTRLLSALAQVREPALRERALALALDPRLRLNERLMPLQIQSASPETRASAFVWLREHYDALLAQLGAHAGSDVIASAAGFCSEDKAREVEGFFAARSQQVTGGPRELALSLESIRACAALAGAQGEPLRAIYAARPAAAKPSRSAP